ncbi:cobalt-precorrin-4 C(11)-methyltransferase CbiF [Gottschalkia acidurici 9a]|uniref:Cobalt-precorrin-4 C(11)-methyltransferase CbiF n=1 Tax=Gottschalkia acidurici (strain ATCC 7906 / DSM 604 / BCRC 14475 / CIP 104303 / KCTC 5404 / NCIMB 10678 / 9a) TaxID=1128398 RepID=K0B0A7_GOTA9|nr:precorrin-4 C(11)-methyltransferase [Gottschalkia acidurici]AFS79468.1 cobalt-precorrin-4 C(11)-methyltransferase CbiF [Gottschalkia acidurici 9a]
MFYFVGAGPGDVGLITVKGRKLLEEADIVIYAGSLVSDKHLQFCKDKCEKYSSASMTLEEVMEVSIKGIKEGKKVVRLHTGDPTIYGAIREQMDYLDNYNIEYEVIPGVSSFTASCSRIKREFTLPDVSQTVIITRIEGRTPVPKDEDLESLARHNASMAIFLSAQSIDKVVEKLKNGYGSDSVPVAVVYKATWEDEKIVLGTLKDIAEKIQKEGIKNFAQILVGRFIEGDYERSLLYNPDFTHGFREGNK